MTMTTTVSGKSLTSSSFYGDSRSVLPSSSSVLPATEPALPSYLSDPLLGPSRVWKIFRKQIDALECIASLRLEGELLPFSYESSNWERLFLVANPDIFWFRDCKKPSSARHTYEIIAENRVSKLYFDLEYDKGIPANRDCDGNEMTKTFIRVVLYYIHKLFGVKYKMTQVLVLDSTTDSKFSVHLVFQIPLVFRTNIHAGHFVRFIANELINIDTICSDEEQLRYDIFKETTINVYAIKDLFVTNGKAARVLFCDLAVYTRNRLFRIYKSSKQNKNAHLVVSPINKWKPDNVAESDTVQYDRFIFLHSLITYFPVKPEDSMVKEFEKPALNPNYSSDANLRKLEKLHSGQISPTKTSPYSDLDKFIMTRIRPHGHIYRNVHFPSTNVTVYDIKGFRYCGNIGRWHKSQNIKLIADINRGVYYQKCHDAECADYKSPEWPIPPEVWFKIRPPDEEDLLLENGLDELEGILNGETTCIQQSTGTPGIQQRTTDNEDTPCIQTSSRNNGAPCIQQRTSANEQTPCIQTSSRNNGAPCVQQRTTDNDTIENIKEDNEGSCREEARVK
uniref:DNA-directed primase/polymerase protein n=1 Tax=Cacopsylla melanoneura TaxID=428564 RepID=A0A8D9AW15_9HEMI